MEFIKRYLNRNMTVLVLAVAAYLFLKISAAEAKYDVADVRIGSGVGSIRVVFDAVTDFQYKVFLLDSPKRLVVDFQDVSINPAVESSDNVNNSLIASTRLGSLNGDETRVVFDLKKSILIKKVFMLPPQSSFGWRFVIDIEAASDKQFKESVGNDRVFSSNESISGAKNTRKSTVAENAKNQAGKKKRIVVLDPGHGGKDPGAIGYSGIHEKNITLAMARELKALLDKDPRYKVYLTRNNDVFISLRERVNIARKYDADMFLSVHADSAKNRNAIGLSVYTLSETASDKEAAALAERENKADIIAGLNLVEHSKEVSDILINLAQRETMNRSSEFATFMVGEMKKSVKLVSNTHRFAGFAVLKAPDVPSVLLEMGYLSNRGEERLLKQKGYRAKLADATKKAIDKYFDNMHHASVF